MRLYGYQIDGIDFLLNGQLKTTPGPDPLRERYAYLGDRMGLGKTVQACVAAKVLRARSVLVIAPASALENWRREWATWGNEEATFGILSWASPKLAAVTGSDWDLVILDEAHYAKTPTAKRTKLVLRIAQGAGHAWLLSGTPMPNHPGELYAPIAALWPEILKELGIANRQQWLHRFCVTIQTRYGVKVVGLKPAAKDELAPYLKRIMIRRAVSDVEAELPPIRLDVSLLPQDARLTDAIRELGVSPEKLEARMNREEQDEDGSVSRLRRLLGEFKAPRIAEIIAQELEDREYGKIVVLAHHHSVLSVLRGKLGKFGVVGFDGGTSQKARQLAIDEFTNNMGARVFVGQQTAAGIAINLQVASEIVLVEPSFVPDENAQAIKRVHRIGSKHSVRARMFAVAGSLDEAVVRANVRKTKMAITVGL